MVAVSVSTSSLDALAADGSIILWLGLSMLAAALALLVAGALRANELFRIRVRDGEIRLSRGRLPPALFDDIRDIVNRENLKRAEIRVVLEGGQPRLMLRAEASSVAQPLRNALGRYSLGALRTGRMRPLKR